MNESILTSIKKLLGITEEYTHFDADIIIHINTVFMTLHQMGVGPEEGYRITDESDVWDDYIEEDDNLEAVKTYVYLKVKMIFDPPQGGATAEAYRQTISELEWRLNFQHELDS